MRRPFRFATARARAVLASTRGVAVVEFALIAPVLFMILLGTLELGRLFWIRNSLQFAVEEAGRYAMVDATATYTSIHDEAKNRLPSLEVDIVVVPDTAGGISFITVTATYQFEFLSGLLPVGTLVLSGKSRVPVN
jgi:Flp pilus assembly protein TadG